MAITTTQPSLEQLREALEIAEQIQTLEAELSDILAGTGSVGKKAARRGRPAASKVDLFALLETATGEEESGEEDEVKPKGRGKKKAAAKKRSGMSEEGRKRIAEAQKRRWAAKRNE